MGNDHSRLTGIEVEDKAVEIADFWSQHSASLPNSQLSCLSVFIGELFVSGPLWTVHTPLEKCSKNLMIYRHPCILKYVSSWSKSSKFYLAVEHVKPLSHVFSSLNTLQLCIGLHSILKGLCFLHEKANASHNNVCISSIYVADDGNWKLGGMEFACKYSELSKDFLGKSRANRYNAAIDVNEEDHIQNNDFRKEFIDSYGFFVLVSELLKVESSDEVPALEDFINICKESVKNINLNERPKLLHLLNHPFFNHEFILIHSFLIELPLKLDEEKSTFFTNLTSSLRKFDEILVASQLSGLLLSRMVLLNPAAQISLLPKILCFRQGESDVDGPLFSEETFKKFLVPRILEIFCVRDAQIRLLLLNHFKSYIYAFSEEELQSYILPELLVGIKDTSDVLVSVTLQALSVLVMILGANTVIGGKRAKLFTDGRPTQNIRKTRQNTKLTNPILPEIPQIQTEIILPLPLTENLPERQRPDGEEVETSTDEKEQSVDEELEWEDWDMHENNPINQNNHQINQTLQEENQIEDNTSEILLNFNNMKLVSSNTELTNKKINEDINELDIKNQKNKESLEDIDFFEDMEPKIESSTKFVIENENIDSNINKLNLSLTECDQEGGWGVEDWG